MNVIFKSTSLFIYIHFPHVFTVLVQRSSPIEKEAPKSLQAAFLSRKADFVKQSEARVNNLRSSAQQRQQTVHHRAAGNRKLPGHILN